MALTQQQIIEARRKFGVPEGGYGLNGMGSPAATGGPSAAPGTSPLLQELQASWQKTASKPPEPLKTGGVLGTFQDVAKGATKSAFELPYSIGHLGQKIQHVVGEGIDAVTHDKYDFSGDADKGAFNSSSEQGKVLEEKMREENTAQKLGGALGTAASVALPIGEVVKASGLVADLAAGKALKEGAKVVEMVAPKLTAKEAGKQLGKLGAVKEGILGTIKTKVDPAVQRLAETVKAHVPEFTPSKTLSENVNHVKDAVGRLADDLKQKVIASGQDRIYSFKELGSVLKNIEKSPQLVGDVEKTYNKVIQKAMDIARNNGGKVSDLFQARKEFDAYIERVFPDLYSSERLTPMRSAVKDIRNAMTDFTAEHLPSDIGLRDSLTNQSRLIEVIENMSEKAASGAQKELGTTRVGRVLDKVNNTKVGKAAKLIGTGAIGYGAIDNLAH